MCAAFSLPSKVQATAVTLFKRFLLGTSLLQHNLKVMMLTETLASLLGLMRVCTFG